MRKYKMATCLLVIILMISFTFFTDYANQAKLSVLVIGLVILAVLSRGNAVYAKASRIIGRRNPYEMEKGIKMMEKALDLGCSENYTVIAATLVLQHGDIEKAHKSLEEMIKSGSKNIRTSAKVSLSMYCYMKGDIDRAIKLSEEAKAEKAKNANLYANLCLYYLAANDRRNYRKTLAEAFHYNATSLNLIDIQAIFFILSNEYKKAGVTLEKLFSQVEPTYPEPYIHYAMVYLKYGHVADAVKKLRDATYTSFSNTSLLTKEEIETAIEGLSNPKTRLLWVEAVNSDKTLSIKKGLPRIRKVEKEECSLDILPGFEALPDFRDDSFMKGERKVHDDPDDVDTELNEDDEKWLERHSNQ